MSSRLLERGEALFLKNINITKKIVEMFQLERG